MSIRKGQATVEMTLLLPLLCLLLFGTLDLARYAKTQTELNNAAHVGVMKATNTLDPQGTPISIPTVVAAVRTAYPAATVTVIPGSGNVPPDSTVTVQVSTSFKPTTPFVRNMLNIKKITGSSAGHTLK